VPGVTDAPATALVLIAHGSRAEAANDAHREVATTLAERLGAPVIAAFLELAEPSIGAGIDAAVAGGAQRVAVLPHFLYPGRHLVRDIPAEVAAAVERHPEVRIDVLPESGSAPAMLELLAAAARAGLDA
jgi:sirohydrochlorin cobaltochelatase